MAGTKSNFQIYNEEFWTGVTEVLQQQANGFNAALANTMRLVPRRLKGEFEKKSFVQEIANLIVRRDPTDVSSVTDLQMNHGEQVGVKIDRRIGPVAMTEDSWRKIGDDVSTQSLLLGRQTGVAMAVEYINTALLCVEAATRAQTAMVVDGTAGKITHQLLVQTIAKYGDRSSRVRAFVMHSTPWHDLVEDAINQNVWDVGGIAIKQGVTATMGRPVLVTDSPALVSIDAGGPGIHHYRTLALVENSLEVAESETRRIEVQTITGHNNLFERFQGEYAFNMTLKGYAYDTAQGSSPTDAILGVGANWPKVASDDKNLAAALLDTL